MVEKERLCYCGKKIPKENKFYCSVACCNKSEERRKIVSERYISPETRAKLSKSMYNLRCKELRENGWRVLCFWECEIRPMEINIFKEKLYVA